jgi:hypothetical protein
MMSGAADAAPTSPLLVAVGFTSGLRGVSFASALPRLGGLLFTFDLSPDR